MRIADLPWYDLDELSAATDGWWSGIAGHLRRLGVDGVPAALSRDGSHVDRWHHADLLLSQACGYDVLYDEAAVITPVATPCYSVPGCSGPRYRSFVIVRTSSPYRDVPSLRGARVAVNEAASHSGTNALRPLVAPLSVGGTFFGAVQVTGSHTDSLQAVQDGTADVACVDAVVLALLQERRPAALRGLRRLACTAPALAPPYVVSARAPAALRAAVVAALRAAVADPSLGSCRRALRLADFVALPPDAYAELESFEQPALAAGYHELPAPRRSPLSQPRAAASSAVRGACAGGRGEVMARRRR